MSDEAAAHIVDLYERHARDFDRERSKRLFERAWLDRFLDLAPANGVVVDIGCGSGEPIARYLIEAGRRVVGVDSSPSMIAMCEERFPVQRWIIADMRELSLDQMFDGVLAFDSFFHLAPEDQRAMFPVFAELALPGAPLMFTSGPRAGVAMGVYHGEPLYHASLDPDEYRALLAASGFDVLAFVPEDDTCGGRTVWLAQRRQRDVTAS